MNLTYILIDFENVQPEAEEWRLIRGAHYRIRLFHGPHQNKMEMESAKALLPLGRQLEFVQSDRNGKNALDFHIAFELGRLVEGGVADKARGKSRFVIVSKDGDFDVLIDHVVKLGHDATRVPSVRDAVLAIPASASAPAASGVDKVPSKKKPADPVTIAKDSRGNSAKRKPTAVSLETVTDDPYWRAVEYLRDHPKNRPATLRKLEIHFTTALGKGTTAQIVKAVLDRLRSEGIVAVTDKKVEYKF